MSEKISMNSSSTGMNLSDSVYERLLRERIIFLGCLLYTSPSPRD